MKATAIIRNMSHIHILELYFFLHVGVDSELLKIFYFFIQGRGNKSSGDNFHAAPNIDHSQDFVREDIKEWLCWLRLIVLIIFFHFLSVSLIILSPVLSFDANPILHMRKTKLKIKLIYEA